MTDKKRYEPGLYPDLSNAEYHGSFGISRSGISEMQKSPLHYWQRYEAPNRVKEEPSEAMALGSAVHILSLEPDKFDKEFIVMPKMDGRTKEGKASKILFEDSINGRQIITEKTLEKAKVMSEAVLNHRHVQQFLNRANIENSFSGKMRVQVFYAKHVLISGIHLLVY